MRDIALRMKRALPFLNGRKKISFGVLVTASLVLCMFLGSRFLRDEIFIRQNGDMRQYERSAITLLQGSESQASYYPPLANLVFMGAVLNPLDMPFHRSMLLMTVLWGLLGILFVCSWLQPSDCRWPMFAVPLSIALLEPSVFFARFDFFPMLAILLACLAHRRGRHGSAGVFLAAGILLKFAPIFLLPLFHVMTPRSKRSVFWLSAGLTCLVTATLLVALSGTSSALSLSGFAKLRAGHPVYALATASSIDLFVRMITGGTSDIRWLPPNLGHFNVGLPFYMPMLLLVLLAAGAFWVARRASKDPLRDHHLLPYVSAVLLWTLFTTPLLTMHYYLWVLPILFLWVFEAAEYRGVDASLLTVGILTVFVALLGQYAYPHGYFDLVDFQRPLAVTLNLLRNMLVFFLLLAIVRTTNAPSGSVTDQP